MCDLGLITEWHVMQGTHEFYKVTKAIHNGLQGMPIRLKSDMKDTWLKYNTLNADILNSNGTYDFVVVHDPQPVGILQLLHDRDGHRNLGKWIWRCHLDLSRPRPGIWMFLKPYVDVYDAAIFTIASYFPKDLRGPQCFDIPPGIDPLTAKNRLIDNRKALSILRRYDVDPDRPFILKVSRFDRWKDFCGIIGIYEMLKKEFPELQLVLIGGGAGDDPEARSCYQRTLRSAQGKDDIYILWAKNGVGSPELNAFQQMASVVVQKSIREGFGLVVAEALWKGRPVVASDVGGISLQIAHGESGYLVRSDSEWVEAITYLLRNNNAAHSFGRAGKRFVQDRFLITRCIRDYLKIFMTLAN
jgi:trehalose synthase